MGLIPLPLFLYDAKQTKCNPKQPDRQASRLFRPHPLDRRYTRLTMGDFVLARVGDRPQRA
jgi:hypothetical protein